MSVEIPEALVGSQDYYNSILSSTFGERMRLVAREAMGHAVSYRNFRVGAVAAVLLPDAQQILFLWGTNNSPYQGAPKRCAEMDIMDQVTALTSSETNPDSQAIILDLFVAGPDNPSFVAEVNGQAAPTLHPCADCRERFVSHPAVSETTRLTTFGAKEDGPIEHHTIRELLDRYSGVKPPMTSQVALGGMALAPMID